MTQQTTHLQQLLGKKFNMEFSKKNQALLYLDTNGFYYYESGLPNVLSLAFTQDSVRDMDVINFTSFEMQIKTFTEQYQLRQAVIILVLSPHITFEKELTDIKPNEKDDLISKFVDTIPFDNVLYRSYPIEKGVKVIGCNGEMYIELKKNFEKCGFVIDIIVPYQVLGTDQTLIQNLIPDNALQFLKHTDRLKQLTMLSTLKANPQVSKQSTNQVTSEKPKSNKPRLYIMAGIFLILFIILGYMIINMK